MHLSVKPGRAYPSSSAARLTGLSQVASIRRLYDAQLWATSASDVALRRDWQTCPRLAQPAASVGRRLTLALASNFETALRDYVELAPSLERDERKKLSNALRQVARVQARDVVHQPPANKSSDWSTWCLQNHHGLHKLMQRGGVCLQRDQLQASSAKKTILNLHGKEFPNLTALPAWLRSCCANNATAVQECKLYIKDFPNLIALPDQLHFDEIQVHDCARLQRFGNALRAEKLYLYSCSAAPEVFFRMPAKMTSPRLLVFSTLKAPLRFDKEFHAPGTLCFESCSQPIYLPNVMVLGEGLEISRCPELFWQRDGQYTMPRLQVYNTFSLSDYDPGMRITFKEVVRTWLGCSPGNYKELYVSYANFWSMTATEKEALAEYMQGFLNAIYHTLIDLQLFSIDLSYQTVPSPAIPLPAPEPYLSLKITKNG